MHTCEINEDVYLHLRKGLRPDIHNEIYPENPVKCDLTLKPKNTTTPVVVKSYGPDPYKEQRKRMDPELHKEYYPEEV